MALLLKIHGYYYTTEGKNLFLDIAEIINKRYSTNPSGNDIDKVINNITERFNNIMQKDSPFDVKLNIPHIYVDNEMVNGSPFTSFSSAHKALGLNPSSNTCNRYIDTNRLYKNKYIFTSKPIDRASRD
jgi:hypothetical protein